MTTITPSSKSKPPVWIIVNYSTLLKKWKIREDTKAINLKIRRLGKASYISKMEDIIMENGKMIEWKDTASFIMKMGP